VEVCEPGRSRSSWVNSEGDEIDPTMSHRSDAETQRILSVVSAFRRTVIVSKTIHVVSGMHIVVRQTVAMDVHAVSAILTEAASWLEDRGIPLWKIVFALGEANGTAAGTLKYQLHDSLFWPDVPDGESAFVHRVAVRRDYVGGVVSGALLRWAVDRTRTLGRPYLRLDCDASRSKLRSVYERFGFRYHSDKRVGPYHVSRYEYAVTENACPT
jgi:GNAT superfamily N-acetyltransferase